MIIPNKFYHIYNRGNNQQNIFFNRENYLFFLKKVNNYLIPHLEILAYCLMPNHFHFLVYSKGNISPWVFSNDLKIMLRSYTRAINKQEGKTGSLFQQHTKIKLLEDTHTMSLSHSMSKSNIDHYPFVCFHYIHQNPLKAKLVNRMEDWEMGSFRDYARLRNGKLCNKKLASDLLNLPTDPKNFLEEAYKIIID